LSRADTWNYQSSQSKIDTILSILSNDTTSKLAYLSSHYPFLMINIKRESCEY